MMTPMPSCATDGMAQVASGTLDTESDAHYSEGRPVHNTTVDRFWIDTQALTNADLAAFAAAIGYVTIAEQPFDPGASCCTDRGSKQTSPYPQSVYAIRM
jgi:formylglycine-generating enzyme required for sulfatase activity